MEEIEVKFLDIEALHMEKKILEIGAKKAFDRVYKIKVFDYPDLRLDKDYSWLRLRDEGDKVTLTFKKRLGARDGVKNDDGMLEHEIVVSDFDQTAKIFESIGLALKFYEEKRRIRYLLEDIEFDIDFCPALKPYLEIESDDWAKIDRAISLLGLDPKDKKMYSTMQIYKQNGIDEHDYIEMTFDRLVKRDK